MARKRLPLNRLSWIDPFGVALCISLTVALYALVVQPLSETQASHGNAQEERTGNREKILALETVIAELKDALRTTQQGLEQSQANLRPMPQMNQRMAELTQLFGDCQLSIDNIQIGEASEGAQRPTVPVSIIGTGAYRQCVVFLHRLRKEFSDFTLTTIVVSGTPTTMDDRDTFHFELAWFSSPGFDSP